MELEEFLIKIGKKIQKIRKEKGLTQENLDEGAFPIPVRTLQDIEAGKANVTVGSLLKISKHLKVKPKDLLDV
ncbi:MULTISPECIES: helix-turn-helix domain-containing protein [Leptospira]|uniref:helix-turn-helix domain-containing protein n=1 Tax=Leptospira TaxID=171 RepID=UPI00109177A8|nr:MULTISPECIES: helix-turn-helix transcriptional regulator [Leptospira]TGL99673.1 XRE family transcriptional regulator [Leptospira jelokensis]TGM80499.1 XRE family transcriptional regulator [Leptospira bouyouniensis]